MIDLRGGNQGLRLQIAEDVFDSKKLASNWTNYSRNVFFGMVNNPEYKKYFRDHDLHVDDQILALDAHGYNWNNEWYYVDGKEHRPVQDWIDEHDGAARALLIYPCNPRILPIHSKRSLVFHQRGVGSVEEYAAGKLARLYVPERGYIDPEPFKLEIWFNIFLNENALGYPTMREKWAAIKAFSQNAVL